MVSDTSVAIRTDPETVETADSLLVYYTEVIESPENPTIYRLKKCDTGIGLNPLTGNSEPGKEGHKRFLAYPNPFVQYIGLKGVRGDEHFELSDLFGRKIWAGKEIRQADFSGLRSGRYILKATLGDEVQIVGIVKD